MPEPTRFETMRAGLVARGLIDSDYRLTTAGNAHVDELITKLSAAEAPRVRWRTGRSL